MKYGIYNAYWTHEWSADYEYYIPKVKKLGFDVLEISCAALTSDYASDAKIRDLKQCADDNGIILTAGYGPTKEQNLCSSDPEVVEKAMEFFKMILPKLQKMDIHILGGGLYSYWPLDPTLPMDKEKDTERAIKNMKRLSVIAEDCGVVLGIENHDRFSARDYAKMAETIDHPQVGLTVDTVNSLSHEEHINEVLKYMAPYCVCLHMKDYVIKRYNGGGGLKITGACLGTGRLDIRRCYDECRMRSDRNFNIILESWMEPCETLEETMRIEDEWAGAGVSYLKALL